MRKKKIDLIKTVVDNDEVISSYEFMSKTQSLSTEDLGKGCVPGSGLISKYRNQVKNGQKIRKNTQKLRVIFSVDMILKGLC